MVYKYLFLIEGTKIKTYQYRDNHFELIRYKGEDFYSGDRDTFWKWWEKTVSFIQADTKIDFLFISDNDDFIFDREYSTVTESSWDSTDLKNFLCNHLPYARISLKQEDIVNKGLLIEGSEIKFAYNNGDEVLFYVKTVPQVMLLKEEKEIDRTEDNQGEVGILYRHYREKTKKYQCD